jgi:hypothetical protein
MCVRERNKEEGWEERKHFFPNKTSQFLLVTPHTLWLHYFAQKFNNF